MNLVWMEALGFSILDICHFKKVMMTLRNFLTLTVFFHPIIPRLRNGFEIQNVNGLTIGVPIRRTNRKMMNPKIVLRPTGS